MLVGLGLELYRSATLDVPLERIKLAERLGFHSVWTAEAYGCDALSPLAFLAAHTSRIKLATAVVQASARTPAATAMHAMTIDHLAGGDRVIIGLGVSGPQVVEGWHGMPWGSPSARLRDYVAIMRQVCERKAPVAHDGRELSLPYTGPGAIGEGKPLKSILHPAGRVGIWIASGGPVNTALAAEVADGWLPMGYGPDGAEVHGPALRRGFERRGGRPDGFEIMGSLAMEITDDVQSSVEARKPLTAMYVGGMGSEHNNFHRDAMARRGFADAADRISELWRAGRPDEAAAAVPDDYIDSAALLGPERRIRSRWHEVIPEGLSGVILRTDDDEALRIAADLAGTRDLAQARWPADRRLGETGSDQPEDLTPVQEAMQQLRHETAEAESGDELLLTAQEAEALLSLGWWREEGWSDGWPSDAEAEIDKIMQRGRRRSAEAR